MMSPLIGKEYDNLTGGGGGAGEFTASADSEGCGGNDGALGGEGGDVNTSK